MVVNTENSSIFIRGEIQHFLEKFCTKDKKSISTPTHKKMMLSCFYYVDYQSQGWYVLDEPEGFHKKLDGDEHWIYGGMYQDATSYE